MILNLYLAVPLACFALVSRTTDFERVLVLIFAGIFAAPVMALLSCVLHQPGATRDLLDRFFNSLRLPGSAGFFSAPAFFLIDVLFHSVSFYQFRNDLAAGQLLAISLVPACLWPFPLTMLRRCIPRRCVSCRRRTLIRAVAARNDLMRFPLPPHVYYWCAACGGRFRRPRKGPVIWLDASGTEDDPRYGLWAIHALWKG